MEQYQEIKQNFINNFFDKIFTHSTVSVKKHIFEKMTDYCPFQIMPSNDYNTLHIYLGNNINLLFTFEWNERKTSHGSLYTLNKVY